MNMKVDSIKALLKDHESDNSVADGLERLKDKALIIISEDTVVSVHDIIQEIAWEIFRQESSGNIGSQSQLADADDIDEVLEKDKGTQAIRSIRMDLSTIKRRKLKLSSNMFVRMIKLQFLDFYSEWYTYKDQYDLLPEGLGSFPNKVRYLRWMFYPLKSLPDKFYAENLVMLDMSDSRVEKLWDGVQNLVNLKQVNLYQCNSLKELPDFSKATDLEVLNASFCRELTDVHPSVFSLVKLEKLDLSQCSSLTSLTSNDQLSCLSHLNLQGCYYLTEFSVTSENMVKLNLRGTGIKALPPSFGSQRKLKILDLEATKIESLPSCMVNLTRLRYLNLRSCSKLQTIPELPPSLETLLIDDCRSLKTVSFPSTATKQFQENKKKVLFWNCMSLDERSLMAIGLNAQINVMKFAQQHLSASKHENYDDYSRNYDSYQAVHVFPGSSVPEWLEYKTTGDSVIIDLSSPPPSPLFGFIFCLIIDDSLNKARVTISDSSNEDNSGEDDSSEDDSSEDDSGEYYAGEDDSGEDNSGEDNSGEDDSGEYYAGEDEKDSVEVCISVGSYDSGDGDHVCVIYDKRCSLYLSRRSQNLSRFEINVTSWFEFASGEERIESKGFGVSLISSTKYDSFVRQMEWVSLFQ